MKTNIKVSGIVIFGVLLSFVLPSIITQSTTKNLEEKKEVEVITKKETKTNNDSLAMADKKDTAIPVTSEPAQVEEKKEEPEVVEEPKQEVVIPEPVTPVLTKSYDELTTEELIDAINTGAYKLEHSNSYDASSSNRFSKARGAIYYDNHKETYYSQNVLPGTSLNIPGRHVADDGTVRDGDGYICVAANSSYLSKGTVVKTSMGPAKVYDSGCAPGIIDIYTNW